MSNRQLNKDFQLFHAAIWSKLRPAELCSTLEVYIFHAFPIYMRLKPKILFHITVDSFAVVSLMVHIKNSIRAFFISRYTGISEIHSNRFMDSFFNKIFHHIFKRCIFFVVRLIPILSIKIVYFLFWCVDESLASKVMLVCNIPSPILVYMIVTGQTEFNMSQSDVFIAVITAIIPSFIHVLFS